MKNLANHTPKSMRIAQSPPTTSTICPAAPGTSRWSHAITRAKPQPALRSLNRFDQKESSSARRIAIPGVSGGGIERLKQAGIRVETGCLESEVQWQNRRFFCNVEKDRTYAVLKWAQSRDGFMDPRNAAERAQGSGGVAITGDASRAMTHAWRAAEMGIAIGVETALVDEPQLNVRHGRGRSPKAMVIDPNGRLPIGHPLMRRQGADSIIHIVKEPSLSRASEICPWNPESGLKMLLGKLWKRTWDFKHIGRRRRANLAAISPRKCLG